MSKVHAVREIVLVGRITHRGADFLFRSGGPARSNLHRLHPAPDVLQSGKSLYEGVEPFGHAPAGVRHLVRRTKPRLPIRPVPHVHPVSGAAKMLHVVPVKLEAVSLHPVLERRPTQFPTDPRHQASVCVPALLAIRLIVISQLVGIARLKAPPREGISGFLVPPPIFLDDSHRLRVIAQASRDGPNVPHRQLPALVEARMLDGRQMHVMQVFPAIPEQFVRPVAVGLRSVIVRLRLPGFRIADCGLRIALPGLQSEIGVVLAQMTEHLRHRFIGQIVPALIARGHDETFSRKLRAAVKLKIPGIARMPPLDQLMGLVPALLVILDVSERLLQTRQRLRQPHIVSGHFPGIVHPEHENILYVRFHRHPPGGAVALDAVGDTSVGLLSLQETIQPARHIPLPVLVRGQLIDPIPQPHPVYLPGIPGDISDKASALRGKIPSAEQEGLFGDRIERIVVRISRLHRRLTIHHKIRVAHVPVRVRKV